MQAAGPKKRTTGAAGGTALSAAETKVLKAMAAGQRLVADGSVRGTAEARFRAGKRTCDERAVERLLALDLIEAERAAMGTTTGTAPARWSISGPGMAFLQRRAMPDHPNRMPAKAADQWRTRAAAVRGARTVNRAENPLSWLLARGKISQRQFDAGERLRDDFQAAGDGPRMTMSWDAAPVERGRRAAPDALLPGERVSAAKSRYEGALAAAGPGLSDMLRRTVCLGEGMETAEKALGWPARSGRVVLTLGLDRVADHYRV